MTINTICLLIVTLRNCIFIIKLYLTAIINMNQRCEYRSLIVNADRLYTLRSSSVFPQGHLGLSALIFSEMGVYLRVKSECRWARVCVNNTLGGGGGRDARVPKVSAYSHVCYFVERVLWNKTFWIYYNRYMISFDWFDAIFAIIILQYLKLYDNFLPQC